MRATDKRFRLYRDERLKGVPYISEFRQDGSINHGFTQLKGRPHDCWNIVEVGNDPALLDSLKRLNEWHTAFFTVGCEKDYNEEAGTAQPVGYIEVSFNSIAEATCIDSHGDLATCFREEMHKQEYDLPVFYEWLVTDALIGSEPERVPGFTSAIFMRTCERLTTATAVEAWRGAVTFLTDFLDEWPARGGPCFVSRPEPT
jgi:hypothetical protein